MFNSCIIFVFCAAKNMPVMRNQCVARQFLAIVYQKFIRVENSTVNGRMYEPAMR